MVITFSPDLLVKFASARDFRSALLELTMYFSDKFCRPIGNRMTPEKTEGTELAQLSKGLSSSLVMNEIISVLKEDLAAFLLIIDWTFDFQEGII